MQGNRMPRPDGFQPSEARPAFDQIVFRMYLEPQPIRRAGHRRFIMRRFQAKSGGKCGVHDEGREGYQDLIGVSEPEPFGVLMEVQVPAGTFFHALP